MRTRSELSDGNRLVLQLADEEFIELVKAGPGESATDFKPKDVDRRHTNLVATNDFEVFYNPLIFETLTEGKQDPMFGNLPYLNGGLFQPSGELYAL